MNQTFVLKKVLNEQLKTVGSLYHHHQTVKLKVIHVFVTWFTWTALELGAWLLPDQPAGCSAG